MIFTITSCKTTYL